MYSIITIIVSICMFLLFGFAAIHKLGAIAVFRATVDEYRLIPRQLSGFISILLIMLELLVAVLLLFSSTRATGLEVMAGLLCAYTLAISINIIKDRRHIDCGCSGFTLQHELSGWLVLRNLLLLSVILFAVNWSDPKPLNWLDNLVVVFAVMVASGLYMSLNQLLAQAPRLTTLRTLK